MMNSSRFRTTLVLVCLVVAACGGGGEGGGDVADETPSGGQPTADSDQAVAQEPGAGAADSVDLERLTGRVLITGTAHMESVTLQIDGGGAVNLSGVLLPELRRLTGAMVSVQGARTAAAGTPVEGFEATTYEVTSIDGQRPSVGILQQLDGGFTITGVDSVRLTGVPEALRSQAGAKVWVVGRPTDSGLQVQSYGVIRDP